MMGGNNLADHLKENRQPSSTNDLMQEFLMCHDYLSGEGGMKLPERRKYRQTILQTLEELKIAFAVNSSGTVALVRQFRLVESIERLGKIKVKKNCQSFKQGGIWKFMFNTSLSLKGNVYYWKQKIASFAVQ